MIASSPQIKINSYMIAVVVHVTVRSRVATSSMKQRSIRAAARWDSPTFNSRVGICGSGSDGIAGR
jgi:hypothetical protein